MNHSSFCNRVLGRSFSGVTYSICRRIIGRKAIDFISSFFYKCCMRLPLRDDVLMFRTEGDFCDNGRALYEYLAVRKDKKRRFVWVVEEPERFIHRQNTVFLSPREGFRFRYLYYLAVAKSILETHNLTQIQIRSKQNYISLWHGLPMKLPKASSASVQKHSFNYMIGLSHDTVSVQARCLDCEESLIVPLGFPRNDLLINNFSKGTNTPLINGGAYSKIIMWMPTFRASINVFLSETDVDTDTGLPLLEHISDLIDFSGFLKSQNVLMVVKIHHLQAEKEVFKMKFDNLLFVQDEDLLQKDLQLYEMMAKTDALLTDYSSVYVDYLLLDRPIGFIVNDFLEYQKSRGIPYGNFLEMAPGQLIYTMEDLKEFVVSVVAGEDEYKDKRNSIVPFFHDYTDGKSCERITDYFGL